MNTRKILIIGGEGQLGSDLRRAFAEAEIISPTHAELDITDAALVDSAIKQLRPDVVINTAAYHRTDQCESQPQTAFAVNALGAQNLARACSDAGSLLIHISTDYVFDGEKNAPYFELDPANPLNTYGVSKLAGEQLVLNACEHLYILRTSGLYGAAPCRAKGENFVQKMLRLAVEKGRVSVVNDEVLTPTWTDSLARQIASIVEHGDVPFGVLHATNEGWCSWYEFAARIFSLSDTQVDLIPVASHEFPSTIRRPRYSVLENLRLIQAGRSTLEPWEEALESYLHLEKTNGTIV